MLDLQLGRIKNLIKLIFINKTNSSQLTFVNNYVVNKKLNTNVAVK